MHEKLIGLYSPAPQSGKTTVANMLCLHGYQIISFAGPLKRIATQALTEMGLEQVTAMDLIQNRKEYRIPGIDVTIRRVLQTLGTEWGRNCIDSDLWVKCWQLSVESSSSSMIVADDVRFPNEAEKIIEMGGEMWKIVRRSAVVADRHASEGSLDDWDGFSRIIYNDGSLLDLTKKVLADLEDAR